MRSHMDRAEAVANPRRTRQSWSASPIVPREQHRERLGRDGKTDTLSTRPNERNLLFRCLSCASGTLCAPCVQRCHRNHAVVVDAATATSATRGKGGQAPSFHRHLCFCTLHGAFSLPVACHSNEATSVDSSVLARSTNQAWLPRRLDARAVWAVLSTWLCCPGLSGGVEDNPEALNIHWDGSIPIAMLQARLRGAVPQVAALADVAALTAYARTVDGLRLTKRGAGSVRVSVRHPHTHVVSSLIARSCALSTTTDDGSTRDAGDVSLVSPWLGAEADRAYVLDPLALHTLYILGASVEGLPFEGGPTASETDHSTVSTAIAPSLSPPPPRVCFCPRARAEVGTAAAAVVARLRSSPPTASVVDDRCRNDPLKDSELSPSQSHRNPQQQPVKEAGALGLLVLWALSGLSGRAPEALVPAKLRNALSIRVRRLLLDSFDRWSTLLMAQRHRRRRNKRSFATTVGTEASASEATASGALARHSGGDTPLAARDAKGVALPREPVPRVKRRRTKDSDDSNKRFVDSRSGDHRPPSAEVGTAMDDLYESILGGSSSGDEADAPFGIGRQKSSSTADNSVAAREPFPEEDTVGKHQPPPPLHTDSTDCPLPTGQPSNFAPSAPLAEDFVVESEWAHQPSFADAHLLRQGLQDVGYSAGLATRWAGRPVRSQWRLLLWDDAILTQYFTNETEQRTSQVDAAVVGRRRPLLSRCRTKQSLAAAAARLQATDSPYIAVWFQLDHSSADSSLVAPLQSIVLVDAFECVYVIEVGALRSEHIAAAQQLGSASLLHAETAPLARSAGGRFQPSHSDSSKRRRCSTQSIQAEQRALQQQKEDLRQTLADILQPLAGIFLAPQIIKVGYAMEPGLRSLQAHYGLFLSHTFDIACAADALGYTLEDAELPSLAGTVLGHTRGNDLRPLHGCLERSVLESAAHARRFRRAFRTHGGDGLGAVVEATTTTTGGAGGAAAAAAVVGDLGTHRRGGPLARQSRREAHVVARAVASAASHTPLSSSVNTAKDGCNDVRSSAIDCVRAAMSLLPLGEIMWTRLVHADRLPRHARQCMPSAYATALYSNKNGTTSSLDDTLNTFKYTGEAGVEVADDAAAAAMAVVSLAPFTRWDDVIHVAVDEQSGVRARYAIGDARTPSSVLLNRAFVHSQMQTLYAPPMRAVGGSEVDRYPVVLPPWWQPSAS